MMTLYIRVECQLTLDDISTLATIVSSCIDFLHSNDCKTNFDVVFSPYLTIMLGCLIQNGWAVLDKAKYNFFPERIIPP